MGKKLKKPKDTNATNPPPVDNEAHLVDAASPVINRLRTSVPRRLLEPVVLLHILDPIRGDHTSRRRSSNSEDEPETLKDLQCQFLDAVAYICDTNRLNGDSVTAAALQDTRGTVVLWLAANTDMKEKTVTEVKWIIEQGKEVNGIAEEEFQDRILEKIVELGRERVVAYQNSAKSLINGQLAKKVARGDNQDTLRAFLVRMQRLLKREQSLHQLVRECYGIARSSDLHLLEKPLGDAGNQKHPLSAIRHNICRLGKHLSVTKTILRTARDYPLLFADLEVRIHKSSSEQKKTPLVEAKSTMDGIIGRMFTGENIVFYQTKLRDLNNHYDLGIQDSLAESCTTTTRVHAELLLVDLFHRGKYEFFKDIPYIGCSKPACYLCDRYVQAHSRQSRAFELGGCHQKLYLAWRPPDLPECCGMDEAKEREDILNLMIQEVRNEVKKHIDARSKRRMVHPDSTTGISYAPLAIPSGKERAGRLIDENLKTLSRKVGGLDQHPVDASTNVLGTGHGQKLPQSGQVDIRKRTPVYSSSESEDEDGGVLL